MVPRNKLTVFVRHWLTEARIELTRPIPINDLKPVVVGGTGGSGTRILVPILEGAGVFMGHRLNERLDAHYPTTWQRLHTQAVLEGKDAGRTALSLSKSTARHLAGRTGIGSWGWKSPQSMLTLAYLHSQFSKMRFIHLVRDGRDMALSPNQGQVTLFGDAVLGSQPPAGPERSAAFWAQTNLEAARYGEENLGSNYLRVRFEDLCDEPIETSGDILDFVGKEADAERLTGHITSPTTRGRWQQEPAALLERVNAQVDAGLEFFGYS